MTYNCLKKYIIYHKRLLLLHIDCEYCLVLAVNGNMVSWKRSSNTTADHNFKKT